MRTTNRSVLVAALITGLFAVLSYGHEAQASCGTFDIVKGDVKIESGSTKKVEAAATGSKICSGDAVITGPDSRAKIVINDGAPSGKNELNLSPDTKLVIENYEFNKDDNKKKVLLNILSGRVRATTTPNYYSDKSKDGQANTFQVRTKSAVAGVRGTDFMTSFDPSTKKSELVTFSGKVEFGQPGPGGKILNSVQVTSGTKSSTAPGATPSTPKVVPPAEIKKLDAESKPETATSGSANNNSGKKGNSSAANSSNSSSSGGNSANSGSSSGANSSGANSGSANAAGGSTASSANATGGANAGAAGSTATSTDNSNSSASASTSGSSNSSSSNSASSNSASTNSVSSSSTSQSSSSSGSDSSSASSRAPASIAPPVSTSMVDKGDMGGQATETGPSTTTTAQAAPVFVPPPPPPPPPPTVPTCSICNNPGGISGIAAGPSNVIVNIHLPGH